MTLPQHPQHPPHPQHPHPHRASFSGSGDGLLLPPSPTQLRRSHSRGYISKGMGHRHTLSDIEGAGHYFNTTLPSPTLSQHSSHGSGGSDQFLGVDLHGPGLIRARSAPGPGPYGKLHSGRPRTPYERPEPHFNELGATPIEIPAYHGPVSGATTPDYTGGSSPSSFNEGRGVATPAMLAAAEKRRKNPAKYQCPQCPAKFTAENSRKRMSLL